MDEHSIKKKLYLDKLFAISAEMPKLLVPLVDIVKAHPINVLDQMFLNINQISSLELYHVYKDKCQCNNDKFVAYILK
jgi:hypothetical protein